MTDTATQAPVVYFDARANEWRATNGAPVCQDHAHTLPCPFDITRGTR